MVSPFHTRCLRIRNLRRDSTEKLKKDLSPLCPVDRITVQDHTVCIYVPQEIKLFAISKTVELLNRYEGTNKYKNSNIEDLTTIVVITNIPKQLKETEMNNLLAGFGKIVTKFKYARWKDGNTFKLGWAAYEDLHSAENCVHNVSKMRIRENYLSAGLLPSDITSTGWFQEILCLRIEGYPSHWNSDKVRELLRAVCHTSHNVQYIKTMELKVDQVNKRYTALIDLDSPNTVYKYLQKLDGFQAELTAGNRLVNIIASFALPGLSAFGNIIEQLGVNIEENTTQEEVEETPTIPQESSSNNNIPRASNEPQAKTRPLSPPPPYNTTDPQQQASPNNNNTPPQVRQRTMPPPYSPPGCSPPIVQQPILPTPTQPPPPPGFMFPSQPPLMSQVLNRTTIPVTQQQLRELLLIENDQDVNPDDFQRILGPLYDQQPERVIPLSSQAIPLSSQAIPMPCGAIPMRAPPPKQQVAETRPPILSPQTPQTTRPVQQQIPPSHVTAQFANHFPPLPTPQQRPQISRPRNVRPAQQRERGGGVPIFRRNNQHHMIRTPLQQRRVIPSSTPNNHCWFHDNHNNNHKNNTNVETCLQNVPQNTQNVSPHQNLSQIHQNVPQNTQNVSSPQNIPQNTQNVTSPQNVPQIHQNVPQGTQNVQAVQKLPSNEISANANLSTVQTSTTTEEERRKSPACTTTPWVNKKITPKRWSATKRCKETPTQIRRDAMLNNVNENYNNTASPDLNSQNSNQSEGISNHWREVIEEDEAPDSTLKENQSSILQALTQLSIVDAMHIKQQPEIHKTSCSTIDKDDEERSRLLAVLSSRPIPKTTWKPMPLKTFQSLF